MRRSGRGRGGAKVRTWGMQAIGGGETGANCWKR